MERIHWAEVREGRGGKEVSTGRKQSKGTEEERNYEDCNFLLKNKSAVT